MSEPESLQSDSTPVLYVTGGYGHFPVPSPSPANSLIFDPADLFDIAYLLRSPRYSLDAICCPVPEASKERLLNHLQIRAQSKVPYRYGVAGLVAALTVASRAVNLVVTRGYSLVARVLTENRTLFREKVARMFLVGGFANDYTQGRAGERLPIDPRLQERHPERFALTGDPGLAGEQADFGQLLTSGEGVIWLPRDICLWRYAAPDVLSDGGPITELLLRELFYAHLQQSGFQGDALDAAEAPVLLYTLPAFLLAVEPDPFAWMRLFRVMPARVEIHADGTVQSLVTRTDTPNLYVVVAIDGQALGKHLTAALRIRPLSAKF